MNFIQYNVLRPSLFRYEIHFSDYVADSLPKVNEIKASQTQIT